MFPRHRIPGRFGIGVSVSSSEAAVSASTYKALLKDYGCDWKVPLRNEISETENFFGPVTVRCGEIR